MQSASSTCLCFGSGKQDTRCSVFDPITAQSSKVNLMCGVLLTVCTGNTAPFTHLSKMVEQNVLTEMRLKEHARFCFSAIAL